MCVRALECVRRCLVGVARFNCTHILTHALLAVAIVTPWQRAGVQQEVQRPTLLMQRKRKKKIEKALPARRTLSSSQLSLSSAASAPLVLRLRSCHRGQLPAVSLQNLAAAAQREAAAAAPCPCFSLKSVVVACACEYLCKCAWV